MKNSLARQFLVATPKISDGIFHDAVILVCEHNDEGAFGLIINKPSNHNLGELLVDLDLSADNNSAEKPVYQGGPLGLERGFILHSGGKNWEHTIDLGKEVFLTTSQTILKDISRDLGPRQTLVILGYASWEAGQLEAELLADDWMCLPLSRQLLFNTRSNERHKRAEALLGIDMNLLMSNKPIQ
ncbi:MAG: YqgE/AlgH family protein [Pseudomonadales bacterium]